MNVAFVGTGTSTVIGAALAPPAITSWVVQVSTVKAGTQVQPAPLPAAAVAGKVVIVTMAGESVASLPALTTVTVDDPVPPATKVAPPSLTVTDRSTGVITATSSLVKSFVRFPSVAPRTSAETNRLASEVRATTPVTVIAGADADRARGPGVVQVMELPTAEPHTHPVPVAVGAVRPNTETMAEISPTASVASVFVTVAVTDAGRPNTAAPPATAIVKSLSPPTRVWMLAELLSVR